MDDGTVTEDSIIEEITFLSGSRTRFHALRALYEADGLTKGELRDRLDGSRTTVGRNLDALCERGLVAKNGSGYTITRTGETITADFSDLVGTVAIANRLEPLLRWLPEEFDVDLRQLVGAELILAEEANPYAPVNRHVEALKRAEDVRLFIGVTGQHAWEIAHRRVVDEGATHEYVVGSRVVETLRSDPNYTDPCEAMLGTGRFELSVYDSEVPYYLGLLDETIQIGVEDEEGMPRALVETDIDGVGKWANDTYNKYRDRSTPFSMEAAP
jgi:predicted transcriptional regulator